MKVSETIDIDILKKMGIRGLTTFIQSRSHLYMDPFELHNTALVIDGYAIACQLYRWHCPGVHDCFGGDYDKYGKAVSDFFQLLFDCNITPYVVFDGGYENRKVATVISRMKNKISTASVLDSVSEGSFSVFPLFLRDCFEEVLNKLGVKKVRCDYEGDSETANIAKVLNCPLLSYDSDFFIFDILYIPFRTFELRSRSKKVDGTSYKYISCKVYRIDKFLNSYGGLDKSNLPILAVLLGNDYVRRSAFALFFQNLKIQKCQKNQNEQQRRIKSLIVWLQNETIESAIRKVLGRYKKYNRQKVFEKIQNAIRGYYYCNSKYLEYLGIQSKSVDVCGKIDLTKILVNSVENVEAEVENDEVHSSEFESSDESDSEVNSLITSEHLSQLLNENQKNSNSFFEKFRKCQYPACFMDIFSQNKYYCIPQVENVTLKHSHLVSYEMLSAIQKILTNSSDCLTCFTRVQNTQVGKEFIPICQKEVPKFCDIDHLSSKEREKVLLSILDIEDGFTKGILCNFPESWSLFLLSIKYLINKAELSLPLLWALVLGKIILEYVDKKIGFYRNKKVFDKHFSTKLTANKGNISQNMTEENISKILVDISYSDSLIALSKLLIYFSMEEKMKTHRKSFDRNLVHYISQFQSCLLHIKYLNCLLNYPYSDLNIAQALNCTFVYNFACNLRKRTNCDNYLHLLLGDSPTVLYAFNMVVNNFKNVVSTNCPPRKRRKKKNMVANVIDEDAVDDSDNNETLYDPNNKFSLLCVS